VRVALPARVPPRELRLAAELQLESTQYFGSPSRVHAMIVEVDPQTFMLQVFKDVVVHDCGTIINPLILAGQIHGGVAQGIANAFYEQLVFDEQGQLISGVSPTICCRAHLNCRVWRLRTR
jgi:CO/xanthine dehydrogenase Mo-binding subunit